jgi:hypothetical protein
VASDQSASEVGIPGVTDACASRWLEHTGLGREALELTLSDPEREIVQRPPRWSGLTPSPEQRFLVTGGGEAVFVLVASEESGHEYTAITCVIRNRSQLAQHLPEPSRRPRLLPFFLVLVGLLVLVGIGIGVYALVKDNGSSSAPKQAGPLPARQVVATSFAAQKAAALRGAKIGKARAVHQARGSRPREVCAGVRKGGKSIGKFCVEIAGGRAVSTWFVPKGKPDRDRFRTLCTGQAVTEKRCPAP